MVMELVKWVFLIAVWIPTGHGLFYHELSMEAFMENITENAYFGYSVAYQPQIERLIVSAPRDGSIGEVYSCDIDSKICTKIVNSISRYFEQYEHNYWFGATVKAGPTFFITCAPLFVDKLEKIPRVATVGHCYKQENATILENLSQIEVEERRKNAMKFEHGMDSFGWSIDVAQDNTVLVGSPAMFTGRVMKYKSFNNRPITVSGFDVGERFNFGYSIASGYFFSERILIHAIGSPYGIGEIRFFDGELNYLRRKLYKGFVDIVGSMFGAVMCSATITGEGRNDLLVGAPTYAYNDLYDIGAVYVYTSEIPGRLTFKRIISGRKDGSHFGSAIVSVGDLNRDNKDEIAIAAPYEDEGRGAVYLYSGYDIISDKPLKEVQRIQPKEYSAFGLSLTALSDYDENGCNELAIGAPGNNKVALVRCMAAVRVVMFAEFPDLQIRGNISHPHSDMNETYFEFQSCMNIQYSNKLKSISANMNVEVEINHPSAKLAHPGIDSSYNVSLKKEQSNYCKKIGVSLPPEGDYNMVISYKIKASHLDSPINDSVFDASRVIVSDRSVLSIQDTVWAAECKSIESCRPNLQFDRIITDMAKENDVFTYVIGSTDLQNIGIRIINSGEVAYRWCVRLRAEGVPVMPNTCEYGSDSEEIKCPSRQRLQNNKSLTIDAMTLKMTELTSRHNQISIHVMLYNLCEQNESDALNIINIKLKHDTEGIIIEGATNDGGSGIVNITMAEAEADGKELFHIYKITNGMTKWMGGIHCSLEVEKKPYIDYSDSPVLHYNNSRFECAKQSEDEKTIFAVCNFDTLEKQHDFTVIVPMRIKPDNTIVQKMETENVTIGSRITVNFDGYLKYHSIKVTLMLKDATIPPWIIILAVLIGLLLLLIIILILRKLGCLRRKNKENLIKEQKSVRRQSMRRSRVANDHERLVNTEEIETDTRGGIGEDNKTVHDARENEI